MAGEDAELAEEVGADVLTVGVDTAGLLGAAALEAEDVAELTGAAGMIEI
ncbi:hypothetical protein [Propionibacterium sp.]